MAKSSSKNTQVPVEEMTYEQALAELEEVVAALEGGQNQLNDAIRLFERGQALASERTPSGARGLTTPKVIAITAPSPGFRPFGPRWGIPSNLDQHTCWPDGISGIRAMLALNPFVLQLAPGSTTTRRDA